MSENALPWGFLVFWPKELFPSGCREGFLEVQILLESPGILLHFGSSPSFPDVQMYSQKDERRWIQAQAGQLAQHTGRILSPQPVFGLCLLAFTLGWSICNLKSRRSRSNSQSQGVNMEDINNRKYMVLPWKEEQVTVAPVSDFPFPSFSPFCCCF